jgi:AcrR family transcriptional regulator
MQASPPQSSPPVKTAATTGGRRAVITREDILHAARALLGPNRSVSTLSLREVTRAAGIAPNSFYRHFPDMDALAIALIDEAGSSLRQIIGQARSRAQGGGSVVRVSCESFMQQLSADEQSLHMLLREGTGSTAFKKAVDRELRFFEEELRLDLIRLSELHAVPVFAPELAAQAVTRLVFAIGGAAIDLPRERHAELTEQMVVMVRMILTGAETLSRTRPEHASR